jgi:chemotaxis protein MotB
MEKPELAEIAKSVQVTVDADGLRVELTDQVEGAFFDSGSAAPKEALRRAVREIVSSLGGADNNLVIEGHTDAHPYIGGDSGYSNWELSAERGNAVRRTLKEMGVPSERIQEVRAYADRRPLAGTDPLEARNRRVSILVQSKFAPPPPAAVEGEPAPAAKPGQLPKTNGSLVDALKQK